MFHVSNHFFVSETDNLVSVFFQPSSPFLIAYLLPRKLMIAAVELDDQFGMRTIEVCNEVANDVLTFEDAPQLFAFHHFPQGILGLSRMLSVFNGKIL